MTHAVVAELQGTVVSITVGPGDAVQPHTIVALVESMKLHHEVRAGVTGTVAALAVDAGRAVLPGATLLTIELGGAAAATASVVAPDAEPAGLDRPDLAAVTAQRALGLDPARPDAAAKRRDRGRRTARENVADLVDAGSFVEYGPLVIAAQHRRRDHDDLVRRTPADGMIGGLATIAGSRAVVVSYDYTVLAGTQGHRNHRKKDRLFELAGELSLPVVLFAEGGGGRPGDTDTGGLTGLDCLAFELFAELSGSVPLIGINAGYCFAGNAALLGCCDVVIATRDSNLGMAGPAMIEGGGLGIFAPTEVGPFEVQWANGVIDVAADDEAHAVALARQYLGYFQGPIAEWVAPGQDALRDVVPTDRLRAYDVRAAVHGLFDSGSVLELRAGFGLGMITALARLEGRPVGVVANNPAHLAGAIDSDGADKMARFLQLCDAHGLPIVTLVDTPGMMVGPDVEATALVRHCSRLFVTGANLSVPMISVVLRKAYGLGAQAMMGGSTKAPLACVAWPTGEFGPMGLEGAVRLGYRVELDTAGPEGSAGRAALFDELVAKLYEAGKALSIAEWFEIDDVIDPADTRRWLTAILDAVPARAPGASPRTHIDTW